MQDKIVRYSLRLNLNKPDHAKICSILRDLHDNFHTTINDFIIEALTYYIENDFQDEEKKKAELSDEVATKAYVKNCLKDHDDALRLSKNGAGGIVSLLLFYNNLYLSHLRRHLRSCRRRLSRRLHGLIIAL